MQIQLQTTNTEILSFAQNDDVKTGNDGVGNDGVKTGNGKSEDNGKNNGNGNDKTTSTVTSKQRQLQRRGSFTTFRMTT